VRLNDPLLIVILLAVAAGAATAVYFLFLSPAARNKRKMRERMKSISEKERKLKEVESREMSLRREEDRTALDKLARRILPRPEILRSRLDATGKNLSIGKYLAISVVIAVVVGVSYWLFTDYPPAAAPFVGIAAGAFLPHKYVSRLIRKRQDEFLAGLAEGLDLIVRGVKSGLPVAETISVVSQEMEGPIAVEFARVTEDTRVGMTLEAALWAAAERAGVPEMKFFVVVLTVQRETGGNLSETLDNLSEMVRSRKQMKLKVRAMSSEARASQYILGGLPFAIAGLLLLVQPDYIMTLWYSEAGNKILMVGGTMLSIGWAIMGKMVNFEI